MYRNIIISSILLLVSGCGHYGPLYYPEQAPLHTHHPAKTKTPTTAATSKQTEDYNDLDALTIPGVIQQEEINAH